LNSSSLRRRKRGEDLEKETQGSFTILVIDDDARVRNLLKDILVYGGHQVIEASDGILGMKCFEEREVDMVLTDLGMPVMNGWEVAKWVKKNRPKIPVGLITGWEVHSEEEKIGDLVVDLIINKPFQVNEILEAVDQFVDMH
jgi:CheY-like chemotaxis protein